ncbi:MAG: NAD(P)/FAD-dependent oxidoreductase [Candidatus Abyssobacteria bacterium SURF_17]|uniref:NAD(P)/FAD-dependent oxidoreductase n=1 Tax=Candidatus Abyssobacteria bacterium SURF_17 TaxID=2093361 RepID=A0A419ENH0_9BACT|nr:MAG: NAD(P)/FAD-dependent oxidoreductase [Candidatus Abyssubacteria bacterium SURF_17]
MKHLIIGNGVAGITAIEGIRQLDPESSIALIAGETRHPYCRPMISHLLDGSVSPGQLLMRPRDFYDRMRVEVASGEWAKAIDVDNETVLTDKGNAFGFDRLLIASGADPRPIKADGLELANIFSMRTQEHVEAIVSALPEASRALVLGGGLVGFKAAYGLLRRGLHVTMLIRSRYPLSMQVDAFAGEMLLDELAGEGLEVRVDIEVTAFEGNGRVSEAHLSDGTSIPCDLAIIGKGVLPATSFVPLDRITVDLGIVVNEHMETSASGIYAAGDVAESIDRARKQRWVNALWPVAVEQGRIAGMNMAGRRVSYKGSLSRNVMRVFDTDILTAGIVNPPKEDEYHVISHCDRRRGTYRKLVFRDDVLVGVVMVNSVEQGGVLVALINDGTPISREKELLLHPSFNYAKLAR